MTTPKKSKPANDSIPTTSFLNTAWESFWGLADDTRAELHKQVGALITVADGATQGVSGVATNVNDRADHVAREGMAAANRGGRQLAVGGRQLVIGSQQAVSKLVASYRIGATQLAATTRDSARNVADRATATARVIVAPSKDDTKAA